MIDANIVRETIGAAAVHRTAEPQSALVERKGSLSFEGGFFHAA